MSSIYRAVLCLCLTSIAISIGEAQWTQTSVPVTNVTGIATDGTRIFVAGGDSGIYVSTDDGETWQARNSNLLPMGSDLGIHISGDTIYAFGGGNIKKMSVTDTAWSESILQATRSLYASGPLMVSGYTLAPVVFQSTNHGSTWTVATMNNPPSGLISSINAAGSGLVAGHSAGIHRSTDQGLNWDQVHSGSTSPTVSAFHSHATGLYAVGVQDFFPMLLRSTDDGVAWTTVSMTGLLSGNMTSLASSGSNFYCTVPGRGVYFSVNGGSSWTVANTGLPSPFEPKSIIVKGSNAFVGTGSIGVWKRPVGQLTSVIEYDMGEVPGAFALHQNYPNPFNPETKIRFTIPISGFVSVRIFDALGQEIAMLVNEDLRPGSYEVTWDASAMASGVYLYSLQTGTFAETRKLLLLR